ncbi:MAG: hypothetical protein ASARMPREDX12_004493 [Alectoria sarmentosa]|nr:MAG: hypothetical protein ASARMPREDX12_004493 [Alectoria sarmentosa]
MELIRTAHALLPRRLTQMYVDTKRSYEQVVQANITNPQLSSLHLKLRIQKDRLVAWGLEWADSKADQTGDIDGSLDRAGISDLVASIMSSIRELLDEAERIQPRSRPQLHGGYPVDKAGMLFSPTNQWTSIDLARLEDIVKDITTSIDTLCDLSRSQEILRQGSTSQNDKRSTGQSEKQPSNAVFNPGKSGVSQAQVSLENATTAGKESIPSTWPQVAVSTRIDPSKLRFPVVRQTTESSPPSYENIANKSDDRVFACLLDVLPSNTPLNQSEGKPVLLDYGFIQDADPETGRLSSLRRYEELCLALDHKSDEARSRYTGTMRLLGWFVDPHRRRYAFVYEVPGPASLSIRELDQRHSPQSLLSFLQHAADAVSNNMPCLEDRFRLAFRLALSLLHIHAKGISHRNINSSNVVFVNEVRPTDANSMPWKEGAIRHPLLTSFDTCAEDTRAPHQESFISSIYRHPMAESGKRTAYKPAYDIYSLGLILLEVGLWMPIHQLWKAKYSLQTFKARLQTVYSKKLAGKCGNRYMRVVEYCLSSADARRPNQSATNQQSSDRQQPKLQTDFYWKALKPLERCCMIDDDDQPIVLPALFTSDPPEPLPVVSEAVSAPVPWQALKADSPTQPGHKVDLLVWSHNIPPPARTYFDTVMMPRLSRMLAKAINRWESYEIDVFMAGKTPETAKPTVLMVCSSILRAWKILQYVNQDKELFDIQVASGQITWSKKKKRRQRKAVAPEVSQITGRQPSRYQEKPTCGASIGCFVDEQHSEAVTFGGIVLVNGEAHGMSVHHMLQEDQEPDLSLDGLESLLADEMAILDISEDKLHDLECLRALDSDDSEMVEDANMGDLPGTMPGEGEHVIVTQPALDDVDENFFPDEDEMSDDHLVSHGLGNIHASSGLRRLTYGSVAHEVDWVLFKIHEERRVSTNTVEGGAKHCQAQGSYPSQVLKAETLGSLRVHAYGSTSGLATGTILPTMQQTKMPGRVYPSPVWRVKGDFGVGGDSGAWVIDNATGGVCGHVTAYSEFGQYATIAPMEVMLHDMEQTLGASVALPPTHHGATATSVMSFKNQIVTNEPQWIKDKGKNPIDCDSYRRQSIDFNDDSGSEPGTTDPISPPLATSPPASSHHQMADLSLDEVAKKWNREQGKRNSRGGSPIKGKGFGEPVQMGDSVQARC